MADTLSYDFLPWARRGLARAHTASQALGRPALPQVTVGLQVSGNAGSSGQGSVPLKLYGPADVVGIDPRSVVRTEPRRDARNVEPNYLAAIEFDPPDFPWLLTPARPDNSNRLSPWLVLLVLREDELAGPPRLQPGRVLDSVQLRADAAVPLPDLAESWMWAHAQLVRDNAQPDPAQGLKTDPARNLSRLLCPRRLQPDTDYIACLVPAFDAGVRAGLGQPVATNAVLGPAWAGDSASGIELPVYYHWGFSTGPAGDFETLARRLRCPQDYAGNAEVSAQLAQLGRIPTEVDADRLLQQGEVTADVARSQYMAQYQGALLSLSRQQPPPEPGRAEAIAARLTDILTAGDKRALGNLAQLNDAPEVPLVGPPSYGVWHARRHALNPAQRGTHWVEGLNLSIPNRMAAGVATRVVQRHQEEFMQAAWSQAGEVLKAERLLQRAHLSAKALKQLSLRVARLPPLRQLQLLAPCAARIKPAALAGLPTDHTLWAQQRRSSLPDQAFDGALRRNLSPTRAALRSASRVAVRLNPGQALQTAPAAAAQHLLQAFGSSASAQSLAGAERFRSDAFASLKALDGLAGLDRPDAVLTLPGFVQPLRADQVKALQTQAMRAQRVNTPGAWRNLPVSTQVRGGVLLDSHWQRLGQLASTLAADERLQPASAHADQALATPVTAMADSVISSARSQPEGVLVSALRTEVGYALAPAQALKVDARNGNLALGAAVRPRVAPRGGLALSAAAATRALKPGQLAAVQISAIRQLGNAALFNSLPASVVQAPAAGVPLASAPQVAAGVNGLFKPAQPLPDVPPQAQPVGARPSITLLPPDRREAVLDRYRGAWRDKLQRDTAPRLPSGLSSGLVVFDAAATAQALHLALQPEEAVAQRVSALLSVGGQALPATTAAAAGLSGVIASSLLAREQFVLSPLRDRVMAYPHLDEALYRRLVDTDREAFMPGAGALPQDTILLTATNPRFVESFLVGSNHEMNRELLWRGFPTDQRGTPFQKFWPYFDRDKVDIQPIHQWAQARPIGQAGGAEGSKPRLALVLRGELLRRYPNTNLYAIERGNDSTPAFNGLGANNQPRATQHPLGGGLLPPDISFFLFDIDPEKAGDYWWILEEPMSEPRFGFDDQEQPRSVPRLRQRGGQWQHATALLRVDLQAPDMAGDTWLDVDWSELPQVGLQPGQSPHIRLQDLRAVRLQNASLQLGPQAQAAHVARALLQRPFRGWFAGGRLQSA